MLARLTYAVGVTICVAFLLTSALPLGVLGVVVLALAPWPSLSAGRAERPAERLAHAPRRAASGRGCRAR